MTGGLRQRVLTEISKVVVSREAEAELLLVAFLAEGHALLEGVPGVSKTLLARAFSTCLGLDFGRVQFTPDMLPLDIVGGFIFDVKERAFEFRKGPVFTNVLLADEVNRAPPKVQSALLEAMQERQVTVEGHTERLPSPHMVIATQNPIEFQGVYPLPEGQLDRFMVKIDVGYPPLEVAANIIKRNLAGLEPEAVRPVVTSDQLASAFAGVRSVKVSDEIMTYVACVGEATRKDERLSLGVSPRATVHLTQCARARAYTLDRDYVTPDDIKALVPYVFGHRLRVSQAAVFGGSPTDPMTVLRDVLDRVKPPR